jgi:hypothetical protein
MSTLRSSKNDKARYATAADFMGIFTREMHGLFLLSFLLTADMEIAERCFVSGLEECLNGMDSFLEWARLWARRSIIKHAIRLTTPAQDVSNRLPSSCINWPTTQKTDNVIQALSALNAFERFAVVMSLLERQSDQDCALLLGCTRRGFVEARARAIKKLSGLDGDLNSCEGASNAWLASRLGNKTQIVPGCAA